MFLLRVFENRVLVRIFGSEREEVVGDWKRLLNEELHNLYISLNIIGVIKSRRGRWTGHVECMGAMRNACKIFVGKPEGKRLLGRPMHRLEDNIIIQKAKSKLSLCLTKHHAMKIHWGSGGVVPRIFDFSTRWR